MNVSLPEPDHHQVNDER